MKTAHPICCAMAWLAVGGVCVPSDVFAADQQVARAEAAAPAVQPISDVALGPGGLLTGRVWDADRQPRSGFDVAILADGRTVATTRTDANGVYAVNGLRGGVHQVVTPETSQVLRLWADGTAPPRAAGSADIVCGEDIVRGQWGGHTPYFHKAAMWATNPFLVGAIVATAVAVPVIIHNTDDDDAPHS
jgi:hypothetical protein